MKSSFLSFMIPSSQRTNKNSSNSLKYTDYSLIELKSLAKKLKLKCYSKLNKKQLINLIKKSNIQKGGSPLTNEEIAQLSNEEYAQYSINDIFLAIEQNNIEKVLEFISEKNKKDYTRGVTPLQLAVNNENIEIVQILIDNGADVNCTQYVYNSNFTSTPLMIAIKKNNLDIVSLLINSGADVNFDKNSSTLTPITLAIEKKNSNIVKRLLNAGAKVDIYHLILAIQYNSINIVKLLINNGVPVNKKYYTENKKFIELISKNKYLSKIDTSILNYAIAMGNPEIVKTLIIAGANIDSSSEKYLERINNDNKKSEIEYIIMNQTPKSMFSGMFSKKPSTNTKSFLNIRKNEFKKTGKFNVPNNLETLQSIQQNNIRNIPGMSRSSLPPANNLEIMQSRRNNMTGTSRNSLPPANYEY